MLKIYKGNSMVDCMSSATDDLGLKESEIVYTLEEKRSIFRKEYILTVEIPDLETVTNTNGTIRLENGKAIVTNLVNDGRPAIIFPSQLAKIRIDGRLIEKAEEVYEQSKIEFIFEQNVPLRTLDISVNPDNMHAYITISSVSKKQYSIKSCDIRNQLNIETEISSEIFPPNYSIYEIKEELNKQNIIYGLIEENINECAENNHVDKLLIAVGREVTDETDDFLEFKNVSFNKVHGITEDKEGNLDFKSIGAIAAIHIGDTAAILHVGNAGVHGINIYGKFIMHKVGKKIKLRVSDGCILKDENTVISTASGKCVFENSVFHVVKLHEIRTDVDLTTGNIKFIGDIIIHGGITEGMKVESGNSISIEKNVQKAEVKANGDITISGNVISSTILGGGEDLFNVKCMQSLSKLLYDLTNLISVIEDIKKFNRLGYDISDGNIIKILLETKFKSIPAVTLNIMKDIIQNKNQLLVPMLNILKSNFIGFAPLTIKSYTELFNLLDIVKNNISSLEVAQLLPVNVQMGYCQESTISSSGNIVFNGLGVYVSDVFANGSIIFTNDRCNIRGGIIKSGDDIKCKIVGSKGKVPAKIIVEKNNHIYIDKAYENTVLVVGKKEGYLNSNCKDVHAYIDESGELIIDKISD